jgi:outer membrane receptor protein involved in Fe transport
VREYYTLDPADLYTYNGPPGDLIFSNGQRARPSHIYAYNQARLNARDTAENLTTSENPTTYEEQRCFGSVEAAARGQLRARCGTLTPFPSAPPNGGLDDFSGNELSRAPRWKITLSGGYEIPLGRLGSLTPRVQYTWQDDTYFRAFNRDFDLQESYHLTDAKLEWQSPEERWSAEVFVQNIEDEAPKHNILIGGRAFGSPPFAWYGPPRFYGFQIGFKY